MRVLVTGGTGFIGRALVASLHERGDETRVVSRTRSDGALPWENIDSLVEGADAIIHLAGEPVADGRWTAERFERIRSSRVDTTRALALSIAKASRKPRVFVSASAAGFYGMQGPDAKPTDEGGSPGDDKLARVAVDWERAADAARAAGVRVVHPRIGVVLGRGGGALAKMAAPYAWFVGGPLGDGRQWVSWIHIRDAVRALLFLVDLDGVTGPVNLVSPAPVTMDQISASIARTMRRPALFRVPAFALRLALGSGLASVVLSGSRLSPRALSDAGFAFEFPSIDEALFDLL